MKLLTVFGVNCLLHIVSVYGKYSYIYPEDHEILYSYSAVITTATESPAYFVSQFNLTGSIKVQGMKSRARVQFQNLKYSMYSGDFQNSKKVEIVELPVGAAVLYEPFEIFYNNGEVSKMKITAGEPIWSRSVKRALGGILQLDLHKINLNKFDAFNSKEKSIHGDCKVLYSIQPLHNEVHITKFYSTDDCQSELSVWSNLENVDDCPNVKSQHNELENISQKLYKVTEHSNDSLLIREVVSEGRTRRFINRNSNTSHFITVSQKLRLHTINDFSHSHMSDIPNSEESSSLQYDATEFHSFKFSTNEDLKNVLIKVYHLLSAVLSELHGPNRLLSEQVNPQESHLIPLLITFIRKLDTDLLEQAYTELEKRNSPPVIDMFVRTLPLVGSRDSAVFLVNLIQNNKVNQYDAQLLLSSLPFHFRQVSEKSLIDFENLLNFSESISTSVKNTAILSFGTLVYRTCKFDKCSTGTVNKYIHHYLKAFKESSNEYSKQLVYLAGLSNIRSESLIEHLNPIFKGEEVIASEDILAFSLRAVFPVIARHPEKAYEVYWPVLADRGNSLELRVTALVLLMEAESDLSVFLQLDQLMADESCTHLYNIYYKLMRHYSEKNNKCNFRRTDIAREIIRTLKKPLTGVFFSSMYKISISDFEVKVLTIGNPKNGSFFSAYLSLTSKTTGYDVNFYSIYVKLKGIGEEFFNCVLQAASDSSRAGEILGKAIQNIAGTKNLHVEFILFSHQNVIAIRFYDENNIKGFIEEFQNYFLPKNPMNQYLRHANSIFNMENFFVTDIGMPGVLSQDFPTLSSFQTKTTLNTQSPALDMNTSLNLRYWSQGSTVLKVKNTIVDIWQGIIRSHVSRFHLPLDFSIKLKDHLALQFNPLNSTEDNLIGLKWRTQTDIFTVTNNENYDALSESCKECKTLATVSRQKAENAIYKFDDGAYTFFEKIFDCENDGSGNILKSLRDVRIFNVSTVLFAGILLEKYFLEQPISGSCGYSALYVQNKEYKVCADVQTQNSHLTLLIGNSQGSNKECIPDNISISLAIKESNESSLHTSMEQCNGNLKIAMGNPEWCEKEANPQILTCLGKADGRDHEKIIHVDVKFKEFPKEVLQYLRPIINLHKPVCYTPIETPVEIADLIEVSFIIDLQTSKCNMELYMPSKNVLFKDLPLY